MDEATALDVLALRRSADRLDELAETADLMGDDDSAAAFRDQAIACRMRAMSVLDDGTPA